MLEKISNYSAEEAKSRTRRIYESRSENQSSGSRSIYHGRSTINAKMKQEKIVIQTIQRIKDRTNHRKFSVCI